MKWTLQPLMMHEQDSDLPPEGYEVVDEAGQPVFDNQTYYPSPPTPEQAAHIVLCVSNHDALLAALEGLLSQATGPAMVHGDGRGADGTKSGLSGDEFNELRNTRIDAARAAIAAAKGEA